MKIGLVDNGNENNKENKKYNSNKKSEEKNKKDSFKKEILNKDIIDLINYKDDKSSMKKLLKKKYNIVSKSKFYESKNVILKDAKFAIKAQANISNEKALSLIGN